MILGNDVASYQGDINYDVYKNNSNFIIPKATEGVGFTDPKFKRNQSEARRVGLLRGYYHFARPDLGNSPEAEADFFLAVVGALQEGENLYLDYECANQVQAHVDWCRKWLDRVYQKTGVKPLIYLNQSQVKKFDWKMSLTEVMVFGLQPILIILIIMMSKSDNGLLQQCSNGQTNNKFQESQRKQLMEMFSLETNRHSKLMVITGLLLHLLLRVHRHLIQ